jgi:hypothetical protein
MEIKLLDQVLNYLLHIHRAEKPYVVGSHDIDQSFDNTSPELMKAVIQKLIKDGFAQIPQQDHNFRKVLWVISSDLRRYNLY